MSIPRAVNSTCGSYTDTSTTSTNVAADEPSWLSGTQTGDATYYETGLGACGVTNTDSDYIVAVSENLFDNYPGYTGANPNDNPVCNKQITASYNGKSVTVTVTDRCTGCDTTSLDFSPSAFQQLADLSVGRLHGMTWDWS
ncbi:RlpA-like double-psi beta-barrel-protein domain-containing protein-containing protein [Fomitopsis serialis]|uniref:RlpA-like double-psi beta-barrel-protein domain-containing protein-containing protein n=1 Tax=Fomitopsis serialis TaxID=139415 RepID=UPI0020077C44|nr:RlpA-like double-psi beta-barrel-protein domain-containing protein-containing protein [Neoantrodia serialis]KAH9922477.1 RlpA-like double-psi beta-barrel-protein domain-containing protein-containing protein [Neoantrodia serialis]